MPRGYIDLVPDASLDTLALCNRLDIVSDVGAPTDLTNSLAFVALTPGDGNGDFTIADDPVSGRRLTITAKSGVATTAAGTGAHAVLSLGGVIYAYGPCTGDVIEFPGTTNLSTFYARQVDPVAPA